MMIVIEPICCLDGFEGAESVSSDRDVLMVWLHTKHK